MVHGENSFFVLRHQITPIERTCQVPTRDLAETSNKHLYSVVRDAIRHYRLKYVSADNLGRATIQLRYLENAILSSRALTIR